MTRSPLHKLAHGISPLFLFFLLESTTLLLSCALFWFDERRGRVELEDVDDLGFASLKLSCRLPHPNRLTIGPQVMNPHLTARQ